MSVQSSGIVGGTAFRVRITGYLGTPNKYVSPGAIGLLEPIELSIEGDIIQGRFYHTDGGGPALVVWPLFETVGPDLFMKEEVNRLVAAVRGHAEYHLDPANEYGKPNESLRIANTRRVRDAFYALADRMEAHGIEAVDSAKNLARLKTAAEMRLDWESDGKQLYRRIMRLKWRAGGAPPVYEARP